MFALYHRDAQTPGGEGQMIDLALYEAPFRITGDMLTMHARTGETRERIGNRRWERSSLAKLVDEIAVNDRFFLQKKTKLPHPSGC